MTDRSRLDLPERDHKPRKKGLTMMLDGGLPSGYFADVIESAAEYVDLVKFGWGTAVVSAVVERKIAVLNEHGIDFYLGGTLFEKHLLQDRLDDYCELCTRLGCRYVEVSNGTIDLSNAEKARYIRLLSRDFSVVSEVGFKSAERSANLPPSRWIQCINEDLDAGAKSVTLEARESGRSGICRADGEVRFGLVEDILSSGIHADLLLFEAPTSALQGFFIERVGPDVNLGNIAATDLVALETLRRGLRADTLLSLDSTASRLPATVSALRPPAIAS
jgi:phosphosulfolactate synthase